MRCPQCGEEHDLSEMEPAYAYPDAYLAIPAGERGDRAFVSTSRDLCVIRERDDRPREHYLRTVMPVPVRGEEIPCNWGVWVLVSETDFVRVLELWNDDEQSREPSFRVALANDIVEYRPCLGLPGRLQLTGPKTRPSFALHPGIDHDLVRVQRDGVQLEQAAEWLARRAHGG
ncbi:MAG: DUF2199 domain-containing protein [Gemmatimonadaceae bacterium]